MFFISGVCWIETCSHGRLSIARLVVSEESGAPWKPISGHTLCLSTIDVSKLLYSVWTNMLNTMRLKYAQINWQFVFVELDCANGSKIARVRTWPTTKRLSKNIDVKWGTPFFADCEDVFGCMDCAYSCFEPSFAWFKLPSRSEASILFCGRIVDLIVVLPVWSLLIMSDRFERPKSVLIMGLRTSS